MTTRHLFPDTRLWFVGNDWWRDRPRVYVEPHAEGYRLVADCGLCDDDPACAMCAALGQLAHHLTAHYYVSEPSAA